jgi:hypothetical protein
MDDRSFDNNTATKWITKLAFGLLFLNTSAHATPQDLLEMREQARHIVRSSRCMTCHVPNLSTSKEKALKVYNLDVTTWSSSMSDRQLTLFRSLISEPLTKAEMDELHIDSNTKQLSKNEIQTIRKFVELELKNRKEFPNDRFQDLQRQQYSQLYTTLKK